MQPHRCFRLLVGDISSNIRYLSILIDLSSHERISRHSQKKLSMTLRCLFLDLNSFFASVEQAEDASLRGRPVAVVPMMADSTCCIAASYEAKAFGVKTGTFVGEAKRMCPGIVFLEADHRKYIRYHHKIIEAVDKCLPVAQVLSIDEMACELMGRERDEKFCRSKAEEIKETIYANVSPALSCSIGIAPNKLLAKVASDMQKPNGLVVINQTDIPRIFYKLVPRDFPGIGVQMEKRLLEHRCLTVERLYQFSMSEMREIWGGITGEIFYRQMRGEDLKDKPTKRGSIGHSHVLPPDQRNLKDAFAICVRLLSKACMRLREEGYFTQEFELNFKFICPEEADSHWSYKQKVPETQDTFLLTKELEKIWPKEIPHRLLRVGITLSSLVPEAQHQLSLFEDYKNPPLMQALDDLNKKYSKNLIYLGSAQSTKNAAPARIAFQRIPKLYE